MKWKKKTAAVMAVTRAGVLATVIIAAIITAAAAGQAHGAGRDVLLCDTQSLYTYSHMEKDIETLSRTYPEFLEADDIGTTADGRLLYHLTIGKKTASKHVLVFGSIHAREYMTTQLIMRQTRDLLKNLSAAEKYKGISCGNLLADTAIHIVPMANPDGVTLSQLGMEGMLKSETRQGIYRIYEMDKAVELAPYLTRWKSNAEGVDLNRNFDALWEEYDDRVGHPSADHFKGDAVACTKEAGALVRLTEAYNFRRTISYHVQGEVIYWYFAQEGELLEESRRFAQEIAAVTGYPLDGNYESLDPAGYKDWAISKKGIPSLTLEAGRGQVPLDSSQLDDIYRKNKDVLLEMLYSVMGS